MKFTHINGKNKGKIILYALSTCVWCKKIKRLLSEMGIAYDYVFVDLLDKEEKDAATEEIKKWNPRCSFPTLVINEEKCILGYDEQKIRKEFSDE